MSRFCLLSVRIPLEFGHRLFELFDQVGDDKQMSKLDTIAARKGAHLEIHEGMLFVCAEVGGRHSQAQGARTSHP
jgi:hypothetical protein